jgi:H+/gluconate symporter-like permease
MKSRNKFDKLRALGAYFVACYLLSYMVAIVAALFFQLNFPESKSDTSLILIGVPMAMGLVLAYAFREAINRVEHYSDNHPLDKPE